jgi:hypothetical protein
MAATAAGFLKTTAALRDFNSRYVGLGSKSVLRLCLTRPLFPQEQTFAGTYERPFRAKTGREHMQQTMCANARLPDHLVGAGEQRRRHGEAERFLAPGYKDKRQALIYPLFYVAPRDKGHCKISSAPCFEGKRDNAHGVLGQI